MWKSSGAQSKLKGNLNIFNAQTAYLQREQLSETSQTIIAHMQMRISRKIPARQEYFHSILHTSASAVQVGHHRTVLD